MKKPCHPLRGGLEGSTRDWAATDFIVSGKAKPPTTVLSFFSSLQKKRGVGALALYASVQATAHLSDPSTINRGRGCQMRAHAHSLQVMLCTCAQSPMPQQLLSLGSLLQAHATTSSNTRQRLAAAPHRVRRCNTRSRRGSAAQAAAGSEHALRPDNPGQVRMACA